MNMGGYTGVQEMLPFGDEGDNDFVNPEEQEEDIFTPLSIDDFDKKGIGVHKDSLKSEQQETLEQRIVEQNRYIGVSFITTAGEYNSEQESLVTLHRLSDKGKCRLIKTYPNEKGKISIVTLEFSLPQFGSQKLAKLFYYRDPGSELWHVETPSSSTTQKDILDFEYSPGSAKPGTLHEIFSKMYTKLESKRR